MEERLLTTPEAAAMIGVRTGTLRSSRSSKAHRGLACAKIPYTKKGRLVYYKLSDIQEFQTSGYENRDPRAKNVDTNAASEGKAPGKASAPAGPGDDDRNADENGEPNNDAPASSDAGDGASN